MDKPRIPVDFNETFDDPRGYAVLLSKEDTKKDSDGNTVAFYEGLPVSVYEEDIEDGIPDNLIADGVALPYHEAKCPAKWICLFDRRGVRHESDGDDLQDPAYGNHNSLYP